MKNHYGKDVIFMINLIVQIFFTAFVVEMLEGAGAALNQITSAGVLNHP